MYFSQVMKSLFYLGLYKIVSKQLYRDKQENKKNCSQLN